MIEKFNFYDIYGYLLPGGALVALLWLPFGLALGHWPSSNVTSAVAMAGFAYVVGHVLQTVAGWAMPSKVKDYRGVPRYPSDIFLDPKVKDQKEVANPFNKKLGDFVRQVFEIEVSANTYAGNDSAVKAQRGDAFFLCRRVLLAAKATAYVEQFEGLYALMCGMAAACWLACGYLLGWAVALLPCRLSPSWLVLSLAALALAGALYRSAVVAAKALKHSVPSWMERHRTPWEKRTMVALVVGFFFVGWWLGVNGSTILGLQKFSATPQTDRLLFLIAGTCLLCGLRSFISYKGFAEEFAKAVWQDFYAYQKTKPAAGGPGEAGAVAEKKL